MIFKLVLVLLVKAEETAALQALNQNKYSK